MGIVDFEAHLPHVRISTETDDTHTEHVIPLSFFEDVVAGRQNLTGLDGWEDVVKAIIGDWINDMCSIEDAGGM